MCWSTFPFTRVPYGVPVFDPQPYDGKLRLAIEHKHVAEVVQDNAARKLRLADDPYFSPTLSQR